MAIAGRVRGKDRGTAVSLLQELFHYGFFGDPREAFDEFEVLLRWYSARILSVEVAEINETWATHTLKTG